MKTPTPAQFCELQLRICATVQQQLVAAIEERDFNGISVLSQILKDLTTSYRDVAGSSSTPSKLFSQGLGYQNMENGNSKNFLELQPRERKVPTIPTSYAYPDGFEGVTLRDKNDEDVWDEQ